MTTPTKADATPPVLPAICDAIRQRERFVLASHARPDGDSIGSQLAMSYALRALGKQVRIVNRDPVPPMLQSFVGVDAIEVSGAVSGAFDAAIVMECSDLARTGVAGLDRGFVINIDHHPDNTDFGALNWFDGTAAACGEMVFDLIRALEVPLTREIATHTYLAILTDTGGFHYSNISPRTFEICRQALEAGVNAVEVSRAVYDSNSMAHVRLMGALLSGMQVDPSGRVAVLSLDQETTQAAGATHDDTEGLVNLPLTVKDVQAVVFLRQAAGNEFRVSLRSKGNIDVGAVAKQFGGGGHKNAAGCTLAGPLDSLRRTLVEQVRAAVDGKG